MNVSDAAKHAFSVASILPLLGLLATGPAAASQYFADFRREGTFQASSWEDGALRLTGSGLISFREFSGVGVVGGENLGVDPGESITFFFAAPATEIRLFTGSVGNLAGLKFDAAELEGLGSGGADLGLITQLDPFPSLNISAQYAGVPILSFTIRATSDVYVFSGLSYSIAPVPEPSEWLLWLSGLGLLFVGRQRIRL